MKLRSFLRLHRDEHVFDVRAVVRVLCIVVDKIQILVRDMEALTTTSQTKRRKLACLNKCSNRVLFSWL